MSNDIYLQDTLDELEERINKLKPDTEAQWGKMNVAQMLGHCSDVIAVSISDDKGLQTLWGFVLGTINKRAVNNEQPFKQNMSTYKDHVVSNRRDFAHEKQKLLTVLDILQERGPKGVHGKSHPLFGRMSAKEWSRFVYKHMDHHLRQFGV